MLISCCRSQTINLFGFIWVWWVWPGPRAMLQFAPSLMWADLQSWVMAASPSWQNCPCFSLFCPRNSFNLEGNTFIYTSWAQFSILRWCWVFCTSLHAKPEVGFVVSMGRAHGSVGTLQQECCTQLCPNACKTGVVLRRAALLSPTGPVCCCLSCQKLWTFAIILTVSCGLMKRQWLSGFLFLQVPTRKLFWWWRSRKALRSSCKMKGNLLARKINFQ